MTSTQYLCLNELRSDWLGVFLWIWLGICKCIHWRLNTWPWWRQIIQLQLWLVLCTWDHRFTIAVLAAFCRCVVRSVRQRHNADWLCVLYWLSWHLQIFVGGWQRLWSWKRSAFLKTMGRENQRRNEWITEWLAWKATWVISAVSRVFLCGLFSITMLQNFSQKLEAQRFGKDRWACLSGQSRSKGNVSGGNVGRIRFLGNLEKHMYPGVRVRQGKWHNGAPQHTQLNESQLRQKRLREMNSASLCFGAGCALRVGTDSELLLSFLPAQLSLCTHSAAVRLNKTTNGVRFPKSCRFMAVGDAIGSSWWPS